MLKDTKYSVLINIGFDPKEIQIYLALLELGEGSILEISKRSKVNRASIYYIIEGMKQKGYVSHLKKNSGYVYMPTDPASLLSRQKSRIQDFEKTVPELNRLMSQNEKHTFVRFFEGIAGVKILYADTLSAKTEILSYANSREIRDHWIDYDAEYVAKRIAKKIKLRGIAADDEYGRQVQNGVKKSYRETRLINSKKLKFRDEINIYDDKIAMASFGDDVFGVIIESKALTETQRSIFEMAWEFSSQ